MRGPPKKTGPVKKEWQVGKTTTVDHGGADRACTGADGAVVLNLRRPGAYALLYRQLTRAWCKALGQENRGQRLAGALLKAKQEVPGGREAEDPGRVLPLGLHRVGHDAATLRRALKRMDAAWSRAKSTWPSLA